MFLKMELIDVEMPKLGWSAAEPPEVESQRTHHTGLPTEQPRSGNALLLLLNVSGLVKQNLFLARCLIVANKND